MDSKVRLNRVIDKTEEILGHLIESEMSGIMAHGFNGNTNIGINQEGGTCISVFKELENLQETVDHDPSGLRRWIYIQLQGKGERTRRIVSTYIPCKPRKFSRGYSTVYAQHRIRLRFFKVL